MNSVVLGICFSLSFASAGADMPGPSSLQVDKINRTAFVARWKPIPKYLVLGELLGYKVRLRNRNLENDQTASTTTGTSILINNLDEHWWEYTLYVRGYTAYDKGDSSRYILMSKMVSATGLQITTVNLTAVQARWDPIPKDQVHGVLLGYVVRLVRLTASHSPSTLLQTHKTNKTSIVITNLQVQTSYQLFVQGYTANDTGVPARHEFSIHRVPSPSDLQFTMDATTAIICWSPIPEEMVEDVLLGYTVSLSTSYSSDYTQTHKTNKTSIVLNNTVEWLAFRVCIQGYTATNTGPSTCTYPSTMESPSNLAMTYRIMNGNVSQGSVVAQWHPIPKHRVKGVLLGYIVRLRTESQLLQTQKTNDTTIVLTGLQVRASYIFSVQGYTANETGQANVQSIYIRSVLGTPTGLSVTILNGTTAVVRWNPIPKDQIVTADFLGYRINLYDNRTYSRLQTPATNKTSFVLTNLKDWLQYRLNVYGYSRYDSGPGSLHAYFQTSTMPSPSGLQISYVKLNTVKANWNPIPKEQIHGVLLGYVVRLKYRSSSLELLQTHKTNKTSIVIMNLQIDRTYQLFVQGYTANATGAPAEYLNLNMPSVAEVSGLNTSVNTTAVVVKWNPIPSEQVTGKLLGYQVRLIQRSTQNKIRFRTNKTSIMFNFLLPGTAYFIGVKGDVYNDRAYLWNVEKDIRTPCGSVIKNQLYGNITMEGISHDSLNCLWTIQGQDRNSIIFVFLKSMNLTATPDCRDNYLAVTEGNQLTRLCETRSSSSRSFVTSGSSKVELFSRLWRYYSLSLSYIVVPYASEKGSWNISNATSISSTSIQVDWERFPGPETVDLYIAVCSAQNKHGNISAGYVDGKNVTVAVTNLIKNMKYEVVVLAVLKNSSNSKNWKTIWKSRPVIAKTLEDELNVGSRPRSPSIEDVENSVKVTIQQLNTSKWNSKMESSFKKGVAREITAFCAKENTCRPSKRRERRSNEYIVFTPDQVHLLPGYPVQVHDTSKDNNNAVVAFYVKFPPGVKNATSGNNPIDGEILAKIINGSLGRIGQDLGKILISVTMYHKRTDRTESTTESLPTTLSTDDSDDKKKYIIIWSLASVAFVILVVIIAVAVVRYCNRQSRTKPDVDKEQDVDKEGGYPLEIQTNKQHASNPAFEDEQK